MLKKKKKKERAARTLGSKKRRWDQRKDAKPEKQKQVPELSKLLSFRSPKLSKLSSITGFGAHSQPNLAEE